MGYMVKASTWCPPWWMVCRMDYLDLSKAFIRASGVSRERSDIGWESPAKLDSNWNTSSISHTQHMRLESLQHCSAWLLSAEFPPLSNLASPHRVSVLHSAPCCKRRIPLLPNSMLGCHRLPWCLGAVLSNRSKRGATAHVMESFLVTSLTKSLKRWN